jgi:DUF1680 family protein
MPVRRVVADERVADDRGKIALERGPPVYCAEGIDNDNSVLNVVVSDAARFELDERRDLLGGITLLHGTVSGATGTPKALTAVPYYAWSNRGAGEMAVWLARAATTAPPQSR